MTKKDTAITYSPYNQKFYQGSWDKNGVDFSRESKYDSNCKT